MSKRKERKLQKQLAALKKTDKELLEEAERVQDKVELSMFVSFFNMAVLIALFLMGAVITGRIL